MQAGSKTVLIAVIVLCSIATSYAWLRKHFTDEEIVSRGEFIVIGHIRDGSVVFIPHAPTPSGGASWEHHAELLISEVRKGQAKSNSMVVSIHYGLQRTTTCPGQRHPRAVEKIFP